MKPADRANAFPTTVACHRVFRDACTSQVCENSPIREAAVAARLASSRGWIRCWLGSAVASRSAPVIAVGIASALHVPRSPLHVNDSGAATVRTRISWHLSSSPLRRHGVAFVFFRQEYASSGGRRQAPVSWSEGRGGPSPICHAGQRVPESWP